MASDLVERLRRKARIAPMLGGGYVKAVGGGAATYVNDDGMRLINPDGPEAADRITALEAEVAQAEARGYARGLADAAKVARRYREKWSSAGGFVGFSTGAKIIADALDEKAHALDPQAGDG